MNEFKTDLAAIAGYLLFSLTRISEHMGEGDSLFILKWNEIIYLGC